MGEKPWAEATASYTVGEVVVTRSLEGCGPEKTRHDGAGE
jgi:hypothetical protein